MRLDSGKEIVEEIVYRSPDHLVFRHRDAFVEFVRSMESLCEGAAFEMENYPGPLDEALDRFLAATVETQSELTLRKSGDDFPKVQIRFGGGSRDLPGGNGPNLVIETHVLEDTTAINHILYEAHRLLEKFATPVDAAMMKAGKPFAVVSPVGITTVEQREFESRVKKRSAWIALWTSVGVTVAAKILEMFLKLIPGPPPTP